MVEDSKGIEKLSDDKEDSEESVAIASFNMSRVQLGALRGRSLSNGANWWRQASQGWGGKWSGGWNQTNWTGGYGPASQ